MIKFDALTTIGQPFAMRVWWTVLGGAALLAGCGSGSDGTPSGSGGMRVNDGGASATSGHTGTSTSAGATSSGFAGTGGASSSGVASAGGTASSTSGAGGQASGATSGNGASAGVLGASGTSGGALGTGGMRGGRGGRASAGTTTAGGKSNSAGTSGASGTSAGGSGGAGDITVPAGYTLVWHDEFDVDGPPNPKNWKFETGFVRNEEDQWYQTANASVADGLLVIEARKEQVKNPNYTGSGDWKTSRQYADYTSSSINTSGLQSWEYGRFELRARIPTASGMWPAWWTLGVSGEWPSNGEIDIMEFYQSKVLANVACGTSTRWQAKWDSATKSLSSLGANWSADFHVWRMDWDDQTITLSLDNQTMNTTTLSSMLNPDGSSPFKQKVYMLINLALGGSNGGSLDGTTFPARYEVDYVRVFQKN